LVSLILANHAAGGRLQDAEFSVPMAVLTLFLSFLMVSTIRFRSFKDLKLNGRTAAVVFLAVGSSVLVMKLTRPAFVLTWLLSLYVLIGLGESLFLAARKGRGPRDAQPSLPPAS
jgi:CDP-diacylglycerol--serine O-phosphatidyltransferase